MAAALADRQSPHDARMNDKARLRAQLLERFPMLGELPPERFEELLAKSQLHRAPAGSVLFEADRPCTGFPLVLDFFRAVAPQGVVDAISGLSFLTHFNSISKGVIDLRDLIYFVLMIGVWLYANAVVIDLKKAA